METINIKFPNGESKQFEKGKPIVVLGSNGAGKTRFSVKIEELNDNNYRNFYNSDNFLVHRLSAQKSLQLSDNIIIKGLDVSEKEAFIGDSSQYSVKLGSRFNNNPATSFLNDYDKMLSLFFARNNKQTEEYYEKCRKAQAENKPSPIADESMKEQAESIWKYLLPNRQIDLSGNEVHAQTNESRYHGKEMSDGERVILYMIVQCLSVKSNSLIIIDEPELHIHKAILNKLWDKLEELRQDCVFMYITHDLDFAVSRNVDEVLWVKSFNGLDKWEYEFLLINEYSDLPEGLIFEIIGTQKKVIFVEGTKDSLDYLIYQELYKDHDYHVIPCGGCSQVINYVKAKKGYSKFNHIEVYGIIDRDFRPQNEIDSLKDNGIYAIDVAEVENLFIVPELLDFMEAHLGCQGGTAENVKNLIIEIFKEQKPKQIQEAFVKEINHQLNIIKFDEKVTKEKIKENINNKFSIENINSIYESKCYLFDQAQDYKSIIKLFNFKELSKCADSKYGLQKGQYRQKIINLLKRSGNIETKKKIIDAVKTYIPSLI
ncbi:DUF4435 domain-containing protein [Clostridium sp. YIM B02515]|uniref:DUF4435 domain-containing protein n=1 Tax=Clostridium rhizosphaerae TaxID=2803861 RepID=A0ABS1TGN0_9CLOT|nr:DUF4435 domain-containing protein [Clostridium rhizosphaerae]MBL4937474.1 DUF4435 domain-containing protein [Clostridium rhizosphaerae]